MIRLVLGGNWFSSEGVQNPKGCGKGKKKKVDYSVE
jgi:hypothetical protein